MLLCCALLLVDCSHDLQDVDRPCAKACPAGQRCVAGSCVGADLGPALDADLAGPDLPRPDAPGPDQGAEAAPPDAVPPDSLAPDIRYCGNGTWDPGEQCEGTDLGGKTCKVLGYTGGKLTCTKDCKLEPRDCSWVVTAGGKGDIDVPYGLALDSKGNAYVAGVFYGSVTLGSKSYNAVGSTDLFVAKLDPLGKFVWSVTAGGGNHEGVGGVAVDSKGQAHLAGEFSNTASFGSITVKATHSDPFVAQLSSSGTFSWVTAAVGSGYNAGYALAFDKNGDSYLAGQFIKTLTLGTHKLTAKGSLDLFVAKVDSSGSFVWATAAGGSSLAKPQGIAVDSAGNTFVTGLFGGAVTFGGTTLTAKGTDDIFVARLDSKGNFAWAVQAGSPSTGTAVQESGAAVALDGKGGVVVVGGFEASASFGSKTLHALGSLDMFIARLDAKGVFTWATAAGGKASDNAVALTVDSAGNSYLAGGFTGPANFGNKQLTQVGFDDMFVAQVDSAGKFVWAKGFGGTGQYEGARAIARDSRGNIYVAGNFAGKATIDGKALTALGTTDIYIWKLGQAGP